MRKIALALSILPLFAGCSSFGWAGHGGSLSDEQRRNGLKDVQTLSTAHDTETFFRGLRRRNDGRSNAFGRDLMKIQDFIDRHFWNYDPNDPYVNYPSDTTTFEHLGRFGLTTITSVPGVDGLTKS